MLVYKGFPLELSRIRCFISMHLMLGPPHDHPRFTPGSPPDEVVLCELLATVYCVNTITDVGLHAGSGMFCWLVE